MDDEGFAKEIRFHGKGGQGVVIGAHLAAYAFVLEGKYASSIPSFGAERRGAPVSASVRLRASRIRENHLVYDPDCVVVMHSTQLRTPSIFQGLTGDGILVANCKGSREVADKRVRIFGAVDATAVGIEELGRPIGNTCMVGALAKATGWFSMDAVLESLKSYFEGKALRANERCALRGFEEMSIHGVRET